MLFLFMSIIQTHYHFKLGFQKVDQHTGGKWVIHGTKYRKDNQLQSLEIPCRKSEGKITKVGNNFLDTYGGLLNLQHTKIQNGYIITRYCGTLGNIIQTMWTGSFNIIYIRGVNTRNPFCRSNRIFWNIQKEVMYVATVDQLGIAKFCPKQKIIFVITKS